MKKLLSLSLLLPLLFWLAGSCNKDVIYEDVDCSVCFANPPDSGYLRPELTIDRDHPRVPVAVYEGDIETGTLLLQDTFALPTPRILMPAGRRYAMTATYIRGGDTIIAVDGDELAIKKAVGQCGGTCYVVTGGFFDLRLKR